MFRVIRVNARLVRSMDEISDSRVVFAQLTRYAGCRVGDLVATVSRGGVFKERFLCFQRRYFRFALREIQVAIVEYVMQVLIYVRGSEDHVAFVFVADQEMEFRLPGIQTN